MSYAISFKSFFPEIFFSFSILNQLLYNTKIITNFKFNFPIITKEITIQTIFILVSLFFLFSNINIESFFYNFILINDNTTYLLKNIIIISTIFIFLIFFYGFKAQKLNFFEFYIIVNFSVLAILLLISSFDLLCIYLLIEMQSLCFYILSSFKRNSAFSIEAGLKYFILGSLISCFYLFGTSIIYGILGTLNFHDISLLLNFYPIDDFYNPVNYFLSIAILIITISILFKIGVAPFHFWIPDIYEGAPINTTIFFSIIPKIALFNLLLKWVFTVENFYYQLQYLFLIVGLFSILIGTSYALQQTRIKRFLIYSSIAQVGFPILALSTSNFFSISYIYFFLIIYIITSFILWTCFVLIYYSQIKNFNYTNKNTLKALYLSDLTYLKEFNSYLAFIFLISFFSIAGLPPFAGFLAKFLIIFELINSNNLFISFLILIISTFSMFYYLRFIKISFFEPLNFSLLTKKHNYIFLNSLYLEIITFFIFLAIFILFNVFIYLDFLLLICHSINFNTILL